MAKKFYTENRLVLTLIALARGKSSYKAKYPKNLLYWDGQRFWADCVNLYKALFNGRDIINPRTGSYQSDLTNTGDVTEWGLMSQCSNRSKDFTKLGDKFECLYMDGHFGGYLGFEWYESGQGIVNCVESTPAWEDGIQFSYVDSAGQRFWCKGGVQRGTWTHHGVPDAFVDYGIRAHVGLATGESEPKATVVVDNNAATSTGTSTTVSAPSINMTDFITCLPYIAYGSKGEMVTVLQTVLTKLGYYSAGIDGSAGNKTVAAIKAIQTEWQKTYNIGVDGIFGVKSWRILLTGNLS